MDMITIYSATWCPPCHTLKAYLDKLGIKYEVKDVDHDKGAIEESMAKSNQIGIPVTDIDGIIIVGFNKPMIDQALRERKLIK